ncbi:hypothetical protein COU20_01970 [Candidatus Kaiserbacteria bacterium CG10_big_fil_rev_8_21_14_0_10_59_10]|uniref:LysM domain-containing protein n=1 Tax=Candidatus Kaiserbacteria bacterium CG10_big_fil_rev_8_21_14_0_10_59_10 TaxID=1974612 RepID=A0A2H0U9U7_9BACT|nr:MAG: hypothetical protein COU20_01970 [Candidatus Kaiserbacteria bacterium CG10_big_fil_rev_8_21_14_0_10_59_10]
MVGSVLPSITEASILSKLATLLPSAKADTESVAAVNLQTITLPTPAYNLDPNPSKGGGDITIVDGTALLPEEGPAGTMADIVVKPKNSTISIYVVREGDTLSGIAELFGVSANTIRWANNIPTSGMIRVGQTLTILPITGVQYTVKKGDTLSSIAKVYGGEAEEIAQFNGLEMTALAVGSTIIIPDGTLALAPSPAPRAARSSTARSSTASAPSSTPAQAGYYIRPLSGGTRTQGIHGYNAVDIAAPAGTPIMASAPGDVIVARSSGWNGGYGQYVVVRHGNGTQTLYAHASSVIVGVGQYVVQGQVIGYVGSTGQSTGPHLHFEIRGGPRNPF